MTAMLAEFFASPETLAAAARQGSQLIELVIDIVTRGQERGEFTRSIDPRLAAAAFFGTSSSIVSGAVFRAGEVTPQEIHRQFMQLTFSGLSPAGDGTPGKRNDQPKHVIVVGGSVAGLGAALAFSNDGHRVTVLERDATPMPASHLEAFERWDRKRLAAGPPLARVPRAALHA